ncbi:MAG TPA: ferredoxin [Acidimicrobiales bacterium]|nr:ferredoxin [Acidimicrobiales bacterium]
MRVRLDADACQGHGRCYTFAPAVFDADVVGHCVVVTEVVAPEHEAAARLGVENCPERALSIVDD